MLTLPDFKEKRVLTVFADYGHQSYLQLTNDNIRFFRDGKAVDQISCHLVFAVFIIGDINITTALLKKMASMGISVLFLNHNLSLKAAMMTEAEGNYLLRQKQYASAKELDIAIKIVANKIGNQEAILNKSKKLYDKKVFNRAQTKLAKVTDREKLLGIEGNVSKEYFQSLFAYLGWVRRAPQTKEDVTNLLLDIGYTYLFNYCDALLRVFSFDTYKGCYHQLFFQRKSLVCDIMEPMRPIIDYQILKSNNLKQIKEKDFVFKNGRFVFRNGFKTNQHYSTIFLETINKYKENIYTFIHDYYHYMMDDVKYKFPVFTV
jgi:CRISPR-associated protein Cas1